MTSPAYTGMVSALPASQSLRCVEVSEGFLAPAVSSHHSLIHSRSSTPQDRLRAFFIFRARSLRDSSMSLPYHIYKKAVGPARAALQEAAPSYLRKRVAKKKPLPIVHMRKDDKVQISQGVEQELVPEQKLGKEVLRHVVVVMPKELVKEWWEFLGGL